MNYTRERLMRQAEIERLHFFYAGRRAILMKFLQGPLAGAGQRILDLGCGTGHMVQVLDASGHHAVGLDGRPEGLRATARALPGARLLQGDATRLPFARHVFDGVLLLDVLEHVDDRQLLSEVRRTLKPGGWLLLTVPALPWLWSYRDEAAGHLRRYTWPSLSLALTQAGFSLVMRQHYNALLFPVLVVSRLLGRNGPRLRDAEDRPGSRLNAVLSRVALLEVRLGDAIRWPVGSTLIALCRSRRESSPPDGRRGVPAPVGRQETNEVDQSI